MLSPALGLADTPVPDKGDTAWMMTSTVLVILMTIPGLALFYGGMARSKNVLSLLMQVFMTFCLVSLLWAIYGYSLAFTNGNDFIGGFDRLFLQGLDSSAVAARSSNDVTESALVHSPTSPAPRKVSSRASNSRWPSRKAVNSDPRASSASSCHSAPETGRSAPASCWRRPSTSR